MVESVKLLRPVQTRGGRPMMPALADVIARVESGNNSFAIRFEPRVFTRFEGAILSPSARELLSTIARANGDCNMATAAMIAASSWGRFQIMGENIYGICRFDAPIAVFLNGVSQATCFGAFLASHSFNPTAVLNDSAEIIRFATVYNGPANVNEYIAEMQRAIADLTTT